MALKKPRSIDAVQRIMSSFKQFERKIDKLQDDVNYQGQTLIELRAILKKISTGTLQNPDPKIHNFKYPSFKTTAIQYDVKIYPDEYTNHTKRKNSIRPLPNKIDTKKIENQYIPLRVSKDKEFKITKRSSNPKASKRSRKVEVPRKAISSLRSQKALEKRVSNKLTKQK